MENKEIQYKPLDKEIIRKYDKTRPWLNQKNLCNAPFNNMYFNVLGNVGPCWLTYLGGERWPAKSVHDIWFGDYFNKLRDYIQHKDLTYKCQVCKYNLENNNHMSVLANAYDLYKPAKYPAMMEFELGNTCNLECVMCKGELSSSIRKNRENLPPVNIPYNTEFVDQLEEFLPHLKEARFNGGEPFLIDIYFDIWERLYAVNQKAKVVIATNASVLNNRVKRAMSLGKMHFNISIDGMSAESYEAIRIRGKFNSVMENFEYFLNYCKQEETTLCLMANPMRENWHELPTYVDFCNDRDIPLWFNTIDYPLDKALVSLPSEKLQEIYDTLTKVEFTKPDITSNMMFKRNVDIYNNVVFVQLKNWLNEAKVREETDRKRKASGQAAKLDNQNGNEVEQQQAEQTNNHNAKAIINKRLRDYFYESNNLTDEEKANKFNNIWNKIETISERIKPEVNEDEFFNMMNMAPTDAVVMYLEVESVDALVEKVYASRTM